MLIIGAANNNNSLQVLQAVQQKTKLVLAAAKYWLSKKM